MGDEDRRLTPMAVLRALAAAALTREGETTSSIAAGKAGGVTEPPAHSLVTAAELQEAREQERTNVELGAFTLQHGSIV